MASLKDLYTYYCRRWDCRPNSAFCGFLDEEYQKNDGQRILLSVDVSRNYLGKKGIMPVLDLVKNTKTVVSLDVSNNRLEHEQLEHMVYCLALHPCISSLILRHNCLHDGSLDHILKLLDANCSIVRVELAGNDMSQLSLAAVDEALQRNRVRKAKLAAEEESTAILRAELNISRASYTTQASGKLTKESSGGCLHFATWWTCPQYQVCVSRRSRVSFVMKVAPAEAATGTTHAGFSVLRSDGIHRVVEIGPDTIIAESPIDAQGHCCVEVELDAAQQYVVVPYTFQPGRVMSFVLTATMMLDTSPAVQGEGWITLEELDRSSDWFTETLHACWTTGVEGGGQSSLPTWRYNPMTRIRFAGKPSSAVPVAQANIQLLLYKAVDADDNDEREIGLDVVVPDSRSHGCPPLVCTADAVRHRHPHVRETLIFTKFTVPAASLDLFVVPSTKRAHQSGDYTLVIFSSVPFEASLSRFPHGWVHRAVEGAWTADCCGGARDQNTSWKSNPSYKLVVQDVSQEEGGASPSAPPNADAAVSVTACLEILDNCGEVCDAVTAAPSQPQADEDSQEVNVDPREAQRKSELAAFKRRHTETSIEACLQAMSDIPPGYPLLCSSAYAKDEAQLLVASACASGCLIVPSTRHAGSIGRFRLHLFCPASFVVEDAAAVTQRERQWQMALYARENETRHAESGSVTPGLCGPASGLPELPAAATARLAAIAQCEASGEKFTDRDFPRGTSSLWLDPQAPEPFDFPKAYVWERVAELRKDATCLLSNGQLRCSPPFPYGPRQWFASVVNALAAKPRYLARILDGYDKDRGFAQFRFFNADQWVSVTVDDYVPVDTAGKLCVGHAVELDDFFYTLAEKAYAKLHRCYEALEPRVVPELTLTQLLSQGLEDVSGGVCRVLPIRSSSTAAELDDAARDGLWQQVKTASKASILQALLMRSDCAGADGRKHQGLLLDHLYGIVDARFIEHQRLVKVRGWRDGTETQWNGKWAAGSANWTETMKTALEFADTADAPQDEFWMSFDEVMYFFTDLLVTEEPLSRCFVKGNFSTAAKSFHADTDALLRAPQFALQVDGLAAGCTSVEVVVRMHRADARLSITRDSAATAKYRNALGLAVLTSRDNSRHLRHVEDNQIRCFQAPIRARDITFHIRLDPAHVQEEQLTIMPFREHEKDSDTPFLLSAHSSQASVRVVPVGDCTVVRIEGSWSAESAGGPPASPTWRNNTQYFLYPSEAMEVVVTVARTGAAAACEGSVGFTVHATRSCCSFLHFDPTSVIIHAASAAAHTGSAEATVRLAGMVERRGMPYVIVPYSSASDDVGEFSLRVVGNKPMRLAAIEPRLDWRRVNTQVRIRAEDGSAGGSPRFPSWRFSPQLLLDFPVARTGRVLISAHSHGSTDSRSAIGLMVLRDDGSAVTGCRRRRLLYSPDDVVATSEECVGRVELEVDVGSVTERRGGAEAAPLVLVVYTATPFREADVALSFYAETDLTVLPVTEWKYTALEEGSWELGQTSGGNRREYASWINNPFLGLATVRPTSVVAVLIQYPRGSEQPVVKRLGNKKAFLPPPITNPDRRMSIELDLVQNDDALTAEVSTGPSKNAEVAIVARVSATASGQPHLLVPVATEAGQDADFKLFIWADQPIDLFTVEKPRLTYV